MRHNIAYIFMVIAVIAMTFSSCKTTKPTYPKPVTKIANVSSDSAYTDEIQMPFDAKGVNITVKMEFDEPNNLLTLTVKGTRKIFVFRDDTRYKNVFHKKFLSYRVMNPNKLSYPVLIQPKSKVYLSKQVKKGFIPPKSLHLFNNWLEDISSNFSMVAPSLGANDPTEATLICDSIVQRFSVDPNATEGFLTIRNLLIVDKLSEKPLSKKEAAAFATVTKTAKKATAGAGAAGAGASGGNSGGASGGSSSGTSGASSGAAGSASATPKLPAAPNVPDAKALQKQTTATVSGTKSNASMMKTTKPPKWIISNDADINTTYEIKLQRNKCFGLEAQRDSTLKMLYDVTNAYHNLISTCPDGTVETQAARQIFYQHKQFLRSKYIETTDSSACPDVQANIRDYNNMVDSIRSAKCTYVPPVDQTALGSKLLATGVSAQTLLDAAHRLDNTVAQYNIATDVTQTYDLITMGKEIIRLMNRTIKEKGIYTKEQRAALEEFKKAEMYFNRVVLKQ